MIPTEKGQSQQSQADELDLEMKRRIGALLDHLEKIGIQPSEGLEGPVQGELDAGQPLLGLDGLQVSSETR